VQTAAGRTDGLVITQDGRTVRLEFKIWGRHDYADVPNKPLKYMTEDEQVGVVVMMNANKATIDRTYVKNVLQRDDCTWHVENPYSEYTGVFHFVSAHLIGTKTILMLHIVFNLFAPYQRAEGSPSE
jgi:hypothetical protein